MQHDQEKYDPVILNLSKSQEITPQKNYLWLFLSSLVLLGVLLVSFGWYFLFHFGKPERNGGSPGPDDRPTAIAESTAVPTPVPSVPPAPTQAPTPENVITMATVTPEAEALTGYLSLNSLPEGADVVIAGKVLGQTPLKEYELEVGDYSVTFAYNGQSVTHRFSIEAEKTTEYTHRFEGFGSLQINTTSSGCEVYVNGQLRGTSPLRVEGLSPGEYTIVLKKVGYHTTENRVLLGKGEHQDLFLTIKRLGSRNSSGTETSPSRPLHPSERLQN